jgi:hypothetical protein
MRRNLGAIHKFSQFTAQFSHNWPSPDAKNGEGVGFCSADARKLANVPSAANATTELACIDAPDGTTVIWTDFRRQIDPGLVELKAALTRLGVCLAHVGAHGNAGSSKHGEDNRTNGNLLEVKMSASGHAWVRVVGDRSTLRPAPRWIVAKSHVVQHFLDPETVDSHSPHLPLRRDAR